VTSAARLATVAACCAAGAAVVLRRTAYRRLEAVAAGWLAHLATGTRTGMDRRSATFFVASGTPKAFGVLVTPECSSAVVTAVVLVVTAVVVGSSRLSLRRSLGAAAAAAGFFVAANLARLVVIAAASRWWGLQTGYHWSHVWAGTFITVFGGVLAAVVYLVVLGGDRGVRSRRSS
jgi:exosortase/archaeosortase family protein